MTPHWSAGFVGLPFLDGGRSRAGVDCWGLICLAYAEHLGVALNPLAGRYASTQESQEIAALAVGESEAGPWRRIEPSQAREFDVLLFRAYALPTHVGLVCGPRLMLHATSGRLSGVELYADGKWLPRLIGAWRHESQA
ncbi:C40 family peptidase [Methylocystis parvus]|uniref:C40 family peptidase n=1 Tax=Methylocystis parvus TaxID=134 RepID=UPI003C745CDE